MDNSRYIEKYSEYCNLCGQIHKPGDYFIPIINLTSSDYGTSGSSQLPRRRLNRYLTELFPRFDKSSPEISEPVDQDNPSSLESEDAERDSTSTAALPPSTSTTPLIRRSPSADHAQANEAQAPEVYHTNFYNWLLTTVILDDLSFREPFINSAWEASQSTEQDLFLHAVNLYRNADQLKPQELVNLPFLPRTMRTGDTMSDIPFLDPLLVVIWYIHIDDVHWMLNVLPWRVVDRPIRTGRSILGVSMNITT
uniref:Uncharacterized protein n=1 Tax=Glyptapanteles indiensis TaxID=92994 RepID=B7S976_GLYIN|nr:conserved hypothetical protein [Glyptapanteles indiensis]